MIDHGAFGRFSPTALSATTLRRLRWLMDNAAPRPWRRRALAFVERRLREAWTNVVIPFCRRARVRSLSLAGKLPRCSFRWPGVALFALLILGSSSYDRSPAQWVGVDNSEKAKLPLDAHVTRADAEAYAWLSPAQRRCYRSLAERLAAPPGFSRVEAPAGSFAEWLRHLPVAVEGSPVRSARGRILLAGDHPNLATTVVLQPHRRRLLDSANMMIRLKAEHAWTAGDLDQLGFHSTSGHTLRWRAWTRGLRPIREAAGVRFIRTETVGQSREQFCRYLETLFDHASNTSLLDDTRPATDGTLAAGDIFLRPEPNGHAVMILDVATNAHGGVRVLLGQGGSPVRTFHVLRSDGGSAWFPLTRSQTLTLAGAGALTINDLRHWVD